MTWAACMTSLASLKMEGGASADHAQQTSYQKSFNIQKWVKRKKKRRERQRRERPEENKKRIFSTISKLQSVNGETPIQEVNVDALNILNGEANQLAEKKKKKKKKTEKNDGKKAYNWSSLWITKEYMPSVCDNSSSNTSTSTSGSEDTDTE